MTVLNWSERVELHDPTGAEHDCYVAAPLTCLVYGGKVDYPLGIYTPQEREALEREDDRPDEQGGTPDDADLGISRRYGIAMHKPTEASLGEVWQVGRMISVGGRLANFPAGSPFRKYAPTYIGGHRWAVQPTSALAGLLFDPLAPNKSPGVPVTLAQVGLFAKGRAVTDLRFTLQNEFATQAGGSVEMGFAVTVANPPKVGLVTFDKGTDLFRLSDAKEVAAGAGDVRDGYAVVHVGGSAGYVINAIGVQGDPTEAWFVRASDVTFAESGAPAATDLAPGLYRVAA